MSFFAAGKLAMDSLVRNSASINEMLTRYGVKFGLYKNGSFHEQIFPFDPIARTIEADEWKELSTGLAQRVRALLVTPGHLWTKENHHGRRDPSRIRVFFSGLFKSLRRRYTTGRRIHAHCRHRSGPGS